VTDPTKKNVELERAQRPEDEMATVKYLRFQARLIY
jgi:hypothetical protein